MGAVDDETGLGSDQGAAAPAGAAAPTESLPAAAPPRLLQGKQQAELAHLREEFPAWTVAFRWSALGSEEWAAFPHDGEGYLTGRTAVGLAAKLRAAS
jgi:hypothetical protein